MDPNSQPQSYLDNEFLFYLLPCYYGLVAFGLRYRSITEDPPKVYVRRILLERHLANLEGVDTTQVESLTYMARPPSYTIKSKLCLLNACLYLSMLPLSLFASSDMFYCANHKSASPLYLFGALAWYFAALLLKRELQRNLSQSLWAHRFFWVFAGTLSITRMLEDYFLPLNFLLNVAFLVTNVLLAFYALYRPEDNATLEMVRNSDIPSFAKLLFQHIELNARIRLLFRIEQQAENETPFAPDQTKQFDEVDLSSLTIAKSASDVKQQIALLNSLPRRNIFIDKKLRYTVVDGRPSLRYFIITQIGQNRFEAQRQYQQFVDLETILCELFSLRNFPKEVCPKISEMAGLITRSEEDDVNSSKVQLLSYWLKNILDRPLFMIKSVLEFLNVDETRSAPFLAYYDFAFKGFCSKYFLAQLLKKKQADRISTVQEQTRNSAVGMQHEEDQKEGSCFLAPFIKDRLNFFLTIDDSSLDKLSFGFKIDCSSAKREKVSWRIIKKEQMILQLNQRIEDECRCIVPFYSSMTSSMAFCRDSNTKAKAYLQYLEKLLKDSRYYCVSLFQFIRFDPINWQLKLLGARIDSVPLNQQQQHNQNDRNSRYIEDYDDYGATIEVLRIDRVGPDLQNAPGVYKMKLRRYDMVYSCKTTTELCDMEGNLKQFYKGIANIPQLQLKDCRKVDVKEKVENFLTKIQSLPMIHINESYRKFYENYNIKG